MPVIGYYNGHYVDPAAAAVPIDERGHQFGDGVYEVIRVYHGRPFLLDWHLDRLWTSLQAVQITSANDQAFYRQLILDAIQKSAEPEASVYLQITRGATARNHVFPNVGATEAGVSLIVRPLHQPAVRKPGKLLAQPDERWANAYIKTINLLPNILAKQAASEVGADEALLVRDGHMLESASSNLWFVKGGTLITAPTDRFILPGITRRYVMQLASQLNIPVVEEKLPFTSLDSMDGIFITSTISEIYPIESVLLHPDLQMTETLQPHSPHPLRLQAADCTEIWQARNLELIENLRAALDSRLEAFRQGQ